MSSFVERRHRSIGNSFMNEVCGGKELPETEEEARRTLQRRHSLSHIALAHRDMTVTDFTSPEWRHMRRRSSRLLLGLKPVAMPCETSSSKRIRPSRRRSFHDARKMVQLAPQEPSEEQVALACRDLQCAIDCLAKLRGVLPAGLLPHILGFLKPAEGGNLLAAAQEELVYLWQKMELLEHTCCSFQLDLLRKSCL